MIKGQRYDLWMALGPRQQLPLNSRSEIGSMRLSVQFKQNFIYSSEVYEPLKALLYSSLKMKVKQIRQMLSGHQSFHRILHLHRYFGLVKCVRTEIP